MSRVLFSLIFLFPFTLFAYDVKFHELSWEEAKDLSIKERKLFYVDFDASYCAVCRNMDAGTYKSQELSEYMAGNVIAIKLDVQSFDGIMWSQQYEVEALPTMLIFDENGKLVKRLEGYQSYTKLISTFKSLKSLTPTASEPSVPKVVRTSNNTNPPNTSPTTPPTASESKGMGLYEFKSAKIPAKGFAVQVGLYADYANVLSEIERFKQMTTDRTIVFIENRNGKILFRLMIGVYDSASAAEKMRVALAGRKVEGLVKDLSTL